MDRSVVYVGKVLEGGVADTLGIENYSLAGENKKRSVIRAVQSTESEVSIVAPVQVAGSDVIAHRGREIIDDELDVPIYVPPSIGVFGLEFVVLALTTLFVTVRTARQTDADAVIFYNFKIETAIPGLIASWLTPAALIIEYEDGMFVDPETVSVIRKISYWLRCGTQSAINGGICANSALANLLVTDNVTIFRGFPSVGMPDKLPDPVESDGQPTVMFSGRFDGVRGVDTFLNVAPIVSEQAKHVRFWVAGYGDDEACARVRDAIASLSCEVTYFGTLTQDEYRQRIASADVHVNFQDPTLPISTYTFPSKLLDYMSAGNIIISTNIGDVGTALDDELYIVESDDRTTLSTAVLTCLTDDRMLTYGKRAQEWVQTECDTAVISNRIGQVLEAATSKNS